MANPERPKPIRNLTYFEKVLLTVMALGVLGNCFSSPVESGGNPNNPSELSRGGVLLKLLELAWETSDSNHVPGQNNGNNGNSGQPAPANSGQEAPQNNYQPPASNVEPGQSILYTIQPGDTLYSIATKYGTSAQQIQISNNGIVDLNQISAGQTIVIFSNR